MIKIVVLAMVLLLSGCGEDFDWSNGYEDTLDCYCNEYGNRIKCRCKDVGFEADEVSWNGDSYDTTN